MAEVYKMPYLRYKPIDYVLGLGVWDWWFGEPIRLAGLHLVCVGIGGDNKVGEGNIGGV